MARAASSALLIVLLIVPSAAMAIEHCDAPKPVCDAASRVYRVASFDPESSAVMVGPDRLVTNRHVVGDHATATVTLPDGRTLAAKVVPSSYPGDLVLLDVKGLPQQAPLKWAEADQDTVLRVAGVDIGRGEVRVYPPGHLLVEIADTPRARLQHDAESFPGNSGGALLDSQGDLVGIVTSGGDGHNEAIPASEIATLEDDSGPDHAQDQARISHDYVSCMDALDAARGRTLAPDVAKTIGTACPASGNRQLIDLAGQAFGRAGDLKRAVAMFQQSLTLDPNAVNSRLGMVVTLQIARRYDQEVPHLRWLMDVLPKDPQVLRFAVQAGKWGGDPALASDALSNLEKYHPALAAAARRFYDNAPATPPGPPRQVQ